MKTELMTLNQKIEAGYTYPEIIPESLQETITEWYGLRYVCDNDNFERFFNRILSRDYHRYNELLRIEAGAGYNMRAGYDWLVNSYLEREVVTEGSGTQSTEVETELGAKSETVTTPNTETIVEGSDEMKHGKVETRQHGLKTETTYGLQTETTYGRTDGTEAEAWEETGQGTTSNGTSASKASPASVVASYADTTQSTASVTDTGRSGPDGWNVQATIGNNTSFNSELSAPTAISKNDANTVTKTALARGSSENRTAGGSDTTENSGKDTVENSGSDVVTNSGKDERGIFRTTTEMGTVTVSEEKSGGDKTTTAAENAHADTVHEIHTGRSGENMAWALTQAKQYIATTSAFEWLSQQIEPCFYGLYN